MASSINMAGRIASRTARIGWFYGVNRLIANQLVPPQKQANYQPQRPVPTRAEMFGELRQLMMEDAIDAERKVNPGIEIRPNKWTGHIARLAEMLRDLPNTVERREKGVVDTAKAHAKDLDLPDYYAQDFHFQTGGHLTDASAKIYDVQVETLFYGSGDLMRRAAFRPIHAYMAGRDQRHVSLLDVACGTGRFLRSVRLAYPRMKLAGLDLSQSYLAEAQRHLEGLRYVNWHCANAEAIPVADGSQDVVTSIFLFHELPVDARRAVAREAARVLKTDGMFIMIDSLQFGDRPAWDGLLEAFPQRFHEPYYRHYLIDDLQAMFAEVGLHLTETRLAFMSKIMVLRKSS